MNKKYVFPLDKFFERINTPTQFKKGIAQLEKLHRYAVYTLPFENFDILLGNKISLTPSSVDYKLLFTSRGGYCHELNGMFQRALQSLGFSVRHQLARVHLHGDPTAKTHLICIACINGRKWLCDIGFGGGGLRSPLPIIPNRIEIQDNCCFRLTKYMNGYMLQRFANDDWLNLYSFEQHHVLTNDIIMANHFTSTHPSSPFTKVKMAALCQPNGEHRLLDFSCSIEKNGNIETKIFPNSQEYFVKLRQYFGIKLSCDTSEMFPHYA